MSVRHRGEKGEAIITATHLLFILAVLVFVGCVGYGVGKLVGISKMRAAERLRVAAHAETDLETKAILFEEADRTEDPDS